MQRMKELVLVLACCCLLAIARAAPRYDDHQQQQLLEQKKQELRALEQELDHLTENNKYSTDRQEKAEEASVNGPVDLALFDPVREPPNVVSSGRFLALKALADCGQRLSCDGASCSTSTCGRYLLSYDEWRSCHNEVFKIFRRDGSGVVRMGDYIGLLQFKSNQWLQCSDRSCQLGGCPGSPSNQDGFEDGSKWCECSEYSFRMSAHNKTIGQALYPGDVVMIYQPATRGFLSSSGHASSCHGASFPPTLNHYEDCLTSSFILDY